MNAHDRACEDYEFELAELVDGALDAGRVAALRGHLDACASCRAFHGRLLAMDRVLTAALPAGSQPAAGFDARLHERIDRIARGTSRDVALARAEKDYRATLGRLKKEGRRRAVLEGVAAAGLVAGVWLGLGRRAVELAPSLASLADGGNAVLPLAGLGIAALAIAAGTAASRILMQRASA